MQEASESAGKPPASDLLVSLTPSDAAQDYSRAQAVFLAANTVLDTAIADLVFLWDSMGLLASANGGWQRELAGILLSSNTSFTQKFLSGLRWSGFCGASGVFFLGVLGWTLCGVPGVAPRVVH